MELKLPMVVAQKDSRLVEAWVPTLPEIHGTGPSLMALRDELALHVMALAEIMSSEALAALRLPPHLELKRVKVETVARDRERGLKYDLQGKLSVLLEKWPADSFWVATPTRLPEARFALAAVSDLDAALSQRLVRYCLDHRVESLEAFVAHRRERLDILEVDIFAPTILPRGAPKPIPSRRHRKGKSSEISDAPAETPRQREERRNRRRLNAVALRAVARNLTHAVRDGTLGHAFGREALVQALLNEVDRNEGGAWVLVGRSGVGKTALVHELAHRLVAREAAGAPRRDLWRVDGNNFIAGMSYVGEWEARARELCSELAETGDILYADDLASLVYAGRTRSESTNVAQYLEPHLARGELSVVAECTPERFERVREEAPTFAALFNVIQVPELTARETLPVLLGVLRELEDEEEAAPGRSLRFSPDGLELLLTLLERFKARDAFPGKAVRLLRRAVSRARTGAPSTEGTEAAAPLGVTEVHQTLSGETGLPGFITGAEAPRRREALQREVEARVAGQPEAVEAATDALLVLQAGVQDPDKPVATYLFVGPTGVGKTEMAKVLAQTLFGSAERMVRFDMSEFASPGSVRRLVGSPGEPAGELTTALKVQPFSVILFDEIEKAHPRVFDALLQLLGEGRLTDAAGHTVDARSSVILLTSNLGVREAAARLGFWDVEMGGARTHYLTAVRQFFRPEFFNRIDRVVPFRSLDTRALRIVVEHQLEELLSRRGIRRGNVLVEVEAALLDLLVEQAFDPRYGARPLRRALERRLAVPLAHHLVQREGETLALVELFRRGDDLRLALRMLEQASPIPTRPPTDASAWTLPRMQTAIAEVREDLIRLRTSPELAALQRTGTAPTLEQSRIELLERFARFQEAFQEIDATGLGQLEFEEVEDPVAARAMKWAAQRSGYRGRGGLRARPGFLEVPLLAQPEVLMRRHLPEVIRLVDELVLLRHLVHNWREEPETLTVLLEAVGVMLPGTLEAAAKLVPHGILFARPFVETAAEGWQEVTGAAQEPGGEIRRMGWVLHGSGLRPLLEPLMGYVVVDVTRTGGLEQRTLAKLELISSAHGDGGPKAVHARDARVAQERDVRRAADAPSLLPPGRVVAVRGSGDAHARHLSTGYRVTQQLEIAAALLRARGG